MLAGCTPWPPEFAERYRSDGYWTHETLATLGREVAVIDPGRVAIVTDDARICYGELDARVARLASGLYELGLRPGDRVVVQLSNEPAFIVVSLALFRVGALPVFALPQHRRSEIEYLCSHAEAVAYVAPDVRAAFDYRRLAAAVQQAVPSLRHVIIDGEAGEHIPLRGLDRPARELPSPRCDDVAFFLLSGGTTGQPKLIPRTHADYSYQLRATAQGLGFDSAGIYLAVLPVAHNAALGCPGVLGALRAGGRVVLARAPSPDEVFPLVEREAPTLTTVVPSVLALWIDTAAAFGVDLSRVVLQVGGATLDPDVARRARLTLGARLTHWFGMAEGLLSYTRLDDPDDIVSNTQGRPLCAADELRVVDEADTDVARGEVGELLVRGPYTLRGYYRAQAHNLKAFTRDGYLRTGDLVRITEAGNMIVEGRIKDVINRGGEKISAEEIEAHLRAHPDLADAAVVAMPDRELGERICAFVIGHVTLSREQLCAFLRSRQLADFKLPDKIVKVDAFPQTQVGKPDKVALRRRIVCELETALAQPPG